MAVNVGQTAALENFGDLQKKYSQSEAILSMIGRMRAQELMADFSERLAMYGVRGDMQALTGDIPLGMSRGRAGFDRTPMGKIRKTELRAPSSTRP